MEHLLSVWPKVVEQIEQAQHFLVLSDYDGTLTPIVERPELAEMPNGMRSLLKELSHQPQYTVGIISGRALSDLKQRVNLPGLIYAGNHGFEIEGPGLRFINPIADEVLPFFRIVHQILSLALGTVKGILVENKGITLSVHFRQVKEEDTKKVEQIVERTTNGLIAHRMVKITPGKKVFEVRPAVEWDKGKAIRLLMKKYGKGGRHSGLFPIYLGDDLTDEDGFQFIEKYGQGLSIYIGGNNYHSFARYYLNSPEEVYEFLQKLVEYAEGRVVCEQYSTI